MAPHRQALAVLHSCDGLHLCSMHNQHTTPAAVDQRPQQAPGAFTCAANTPSTLTLRQPLTLYSIHDSHPALAARQHMLCIALGSILS
jgi:hypothetical protein